MMGKYKENLLIMPVVDALAERTEEGRVYDRDNVGLVSMNLYPAVSEWSNPPAEEAGTLTGIVRKDK